jgi:hypothetical protein
MFVAMIMVSWRKWADPLIDYGRQIYIPWEMLQGKVLYRDIAWMHGPLAEHFNMLVFWLAGVSLTVTFTVNLTLIALMTGLVYHYFRRCTDTLTATFLGLVLLPIFCFGNYTYFGCFNFVSPYNFDLTYGIFLNILLLVCLQQHLYATTSPLAPAANFVPPDTISDTTPNSTPDTIPATSTTSTTPVNSANSANSATLAHFATPTNFLPNLPISTPWLYLVGFLWGLIFLTKAETMLAATAVIIGYFLLTLSPTNWRRQATLFATLFFIALLPIALFLAYFLTKMPLPTALQGITGNWYHILYSTPNKDAFYLTILGLDLPLENLLFLAGMFFGYCGLTILAVGSDYLLRNYGQWPKLINSGLLLLTTLLVWLLNLPWGNLGRPLILLTGGGVGLLIWQLWPVRQYPDKQQQLLPLILWGLFSLTLLTKMLLHVRIYFYGFALSLGATMFVLAFSLYTLPQLLRQRYGGGHYCRTVFLTFFSIALIFYTYTCANVYDRKGLPLGEQADRFYGYKASISPLAIGIDYALKELRPRMQPHHTLMVFPEGAMLNFQLRRFNPTPYSAFTPYDFNTYGGEPRVLARIIQTPPDFVVLIHREVLEYKLPPFGNDPRYGQQIMNWLRENYHEIGLFGAVPFVSTNFGVAIWQRNSTTK